MAERVLAIRFARRQLQMHRRALKGDNQREGRGTRFRGGHGELLQGDDGSPADVYIDLIHGRCQILPDSHATSLNGRRHAKEVVPDAAGEVSAHGGGILLQHGRDENGVPDHELVINTPRLPVLRKREEQGSYIRRARGAGFVQERVPERQQAIPPVCPLPPSACRTAPNSSPPRRSFQARSTWRRCHPSSAPPRSPRRRSWNATTQTAASPSRRPSSPGASPAPPSSRKCYACRTSSPRRGEACLTTRFSHTIPACC